MSEESKATEKVAEEIGCLCIAILFVATMVGGAISFGLLGVSSAIRESHKQEQSK